MLVLSRRVGEQVLIGENISVTVVSVRGDKIRLGFTAPGDVPIHREEVYRRISEARLEASLPSGRELEALCP